MNKYWILSLAVLSTVSLSACSFGGDTNDVKPQKQNIDTRTGASGVIGSDKSYSWSVTSISTSSWVVDPANDLFWNATTVVETQDDAVKQLDAELKNLESTWTVSSWIVK